MGNSSGSTYVRWGRTSCPSTSELVYDGYAGGGYHGEQGSGTNYLCLPKDPEWVQVHTTPYEGHVHGAEYQDIGSLFQAINDKDVPCAVCQTKSSNILMIPAKQSCHTGWVLEYSGYLMSGYKDHPSQKEFVCMDGNPETLPDTQANTDGALFYLQTAKCGSLTCPPYIDGRELTCAVCTKWFQVMFCVYLLCNLCSFFLFIVIEINMTYDCIWFMITRLVRYNHIVEQNKANASLNCLWIAFTNVWYITVRVTVPQLFPIVRYGIQWLNYCQPVNLYILRFWRFSY